jgi:hypothetical protein
MIFKKKEKKEKTLPNLTTPHPIKIIKACQVFNTCRLLFFYSDKRERIAS